MNTSKVKLIATVMALAIASMELSGCGHESKTQKSTGKTMEARSAQLQQPMHDIDRPDTDPRKWMAIMEIWHCNDGTYHLQSTYTLRGIYLSLEEARSAKTNWAFEIVEAVKSGALNMKIPTVETCGVKTN